MLITAASHSAAFKVDRLLNSTLVYLGEQLGMPVIPGRKFIRLPDTKSPSYISEMLNLCLNNQISTIFPLKLSEILELSGARQLFKEYGISIIIPSDSHIQALLNQKTLIGSELLILSEGEIIAGIVPTGFEAPKDEQSGIFSWTLEDGSLRYHLFSVDYVEI